MSTMYSAHLSRKRFSLFFAAVFTVLSFGVTPAKAADIRLLDVVEVFEEGDSRESGEFNSREGEPDWKFKRNARGY